MANINADGLETTYLDSGTDNQGHAGQGFMHARPALMQLVSKLRDLINLRGQADGVCGLDENGHIEDEFIDKNQPNGTAGLDEHGKVIGFKPFVAGDGIVYSETKNQFEHAKTNAAIPRLPATELGKTISSLTLNNKGHIETLARDYHPVVVRANFGNNHTYPPLLSVGLSGTWKLIINEIVDRSFNTSYSYQALTGFSGHPPIYPVYETRIGYRTVYHHLRYALYIRLSL